MQLSADTLRRTLRWLHRFRHRKGYGIHSPFAFDFVTGTIYGRDGDRKLPLPCGNESDARTNLRPKDLRLLVRLARYQSPATCCVWGWGRESAPARALRIGSPDTHYIYRDRDKAPAPADMVVAAPGWEREAHALPPALNAGGMLVVCPLDTSARLRAWAAVQQHTQAVVTFDLADFGIAFNNPKLQRQHYVINYW